ncbi:MAG: hypothetical protein QXZ25_04535 [Candidatus Bathyarchaeia archaeon]
MSLLLKLKNKIKQKGLKTTVQNICSSLSYRTVSYPRRLKTTYKVLSSLPKLIQQIAERFNADPISYLNEVRDKTLAYIESNHLPEISIGAYSYKNGGTPVLYASCYAALTMHLYGRLQSLTESAKKEWADYILSFQCDDGLFRDPVIACPLAEEADWWGWRHLTLHVLMALSALGAVAARPFAMIKPFRKKGFMSQWLATRNWENDPAGVSNEVQNYGTILQYARDFQNETWCQDALNEMYDWLDKTQDSGTGLWGSRFDDPVSLSNGVQTGYHLWLLYFYDRRPIQYTERIIDSCLKTQNRLGGYGVQLNSSACEDIDSIDPLVRLSHLTDYRNEDIRQSLERALLWILANQNPDGGWVFRRYEAFQYGHPNMLARSEESSMFPTWFRSLTLAYISQEINDIFPKYFWFKGPGHQFWESSK